MFWDRWIPEKYVVKSEVCGIEICYTEEGLTINYVILKSKSKKLRVSTSGAASSINELPTSLLKNKIPLVLIVNGKGVILKKIEFNHGENPDLQELVKTNLPAINQEDFFIQFYRQENNNGFLAICRKAQVETLLSEIKEKRYDIAGLMIGAPAIIGVRPLWDHFQILNTTLHSVNLLNNSVETIVPKSAPGNEEQLFGDLRIQASKMLSFSASLSYLLHLPVAENNNSELDRLQETHVEKNKFRFLVVGIIGIAFLLAAINMALYMNLYDAHNKLETELAVYQGKYEQVNQVLTDYQNNKNLIENVGILNKNKLSEYADKIAATIPDEVVLSELYFNPKVDDTDQTSDSLVTFTQKTIVIKGNCNKSLTINEWINVLKMQSFIREVSLEKFVYSNDGIIPNYEIKLVTK